MEAQAYLCCVICLDPISKERSMHLDCNHVFHTSCMLRYIAASLKNRVQCPVCRRDVIDLSPALGGCVAQEAFPQVSVTVSPMLPEGATDGGPGRASTERTSRMLSGIGLALLFGLWVFASFQG